MKLCKLRCNVKIATSEQIVWETFKVSIFKRIFFQRLLIADKKEEIYLQKYLFSSVIMPTKNKVIDDICVWKKNCVGMFVDLLIWKLKHFVLPWVPRCQNYLISFLLLPRVISKSIFDFIWFLCDLHFSLASFKIFRIDFCFALKMNFPFRLIA